MDPQVQRESGKDRGKGGEWRVWFGRWLRAEAIPSDHNDMEAGRGVDEVGAPPV